ncbi:MAG: hypothetical protein HKL84_01040 [Acidimicrobiaceae bacterium]|nr:hypothetical protein [Acidimicrobiaceae bacterium]
MKSDGRSQREAVTVIFRLLEVAAAGEFEVARELAKRANELDVSGVNSDLLSALHCYLESGASAESKQQLQRIVAATPYEVAARQMLDAKE